MDSGENFAKMVRTFKESFLACIVQDMIVVNTYQISEKVWNINDNSILMFKIKYKFKIDYSVANIVKRVYNCSYY